MADNYKVLDQRETTELAPGGRFREVVVVTFETWHGNVGTVRVPASIYSPQAVHDAITPYAQALDDTLHL